MDNNTQNQPHPLPIPDAPLNARELELVAAMQEKIDKAIAARREVPRVA